MCKLFSVLAAPLKNLLETLVYLFRFLYIKYRSSSIKDKIQRLSKELQSLSNILARPDDISSRTLAFRVLNYGNIAKSG